MVAFLKIIYKAILPVVSQRFSWQEWALIAFCIHFPSRDKNEVLADLCVFKPKEGIEGGLGFLCYLLLSVLQ